VRRALPIVAGCAVAGAALNVVLALESPTVYEATSTVLVADAPLYLSAPGAPASKWYTMDTEAARLVSEPVLNAAREATGEQDITERVKLSAIPTTKVLRVTYRSTNRQAASRGAATITAKYLEIRRAELEERRRNRVEVIGQQLTGLNERLERTVDFRTPAEAATQRAIRVAVAAQIAERQAESRRVRRASVYPGQVLRSGGTIVVRRDDPVVPGARGAALGILGGAVLAAAGAGRLGGTADVQRLIPSGAVIRLRRRRDLKLGLPGWDPIASALLRTRPEAIVVARTGPQARNAQSVVAGQLATVLMAHGRTARVTQLVGGDRPHAVAPSGMTVVLPCDSLDAETSSVLAAETRHVVLVATPSTHRRHVVAALHRASELGATISGIVLVPRKVRWPRRASTGLIRSRI